MNSVGYKYWLHQDALCSVVAVSSAGGAALERYAYGTFGETPSSLPILREAADVEAVFGGLGACRIDRDDQRIEEWTPKTVVP